MAKLSLDAQISQVSVNSGDAIMGIKWQDRYRVPFIESLEQARDRLQTPALLAQEGQLADALQSFVQSLLHVRTMWVCPFALRGPPLRGMETDASTNLSSIVNVRH
jgi:hypothetical protein